VIGSRKCVAALVGILTPVGPQSTNGAIRQREEAGV